MDKRFITKYEEGSAFGLKKVVVVDRETGVNYLWMSGGYSGGLTVLLDSDGKPVVTPIGGKNDHLY